MLELIFGSIQINANQRAKKKIGVVGANTRENKSWLGAPNPATTTIRFLLLNTVTTTIDVTL
jgi:hypothetical protein